MTAYYEDLSALRQARAKAKAYGLEAQDGFWLISDEDLFDMIGRGACGPGKGIWEKLVPDVVLGINFYYACPIHDYDYATGKTAKDKEQGDLRLGSNLFKIIDIECPELVDKTRHDLAIQAAQTYYLFVHAFGEDSFYEGKA